jgi:hypothetical protein
MKITAKYLLVALLACSAGAVQASYDDYANESRGCCFSSCYECGCNPLYCGAWDLQIQAGVNPIKWRHRGNLFVNDCTNSPANPFVVLGQIRSFNDFFKTPWIVGGQIGHHWSDNARVYVEFNYSQAKAKTSILIAPGATTLATTFDKYKIFDAYVGARYYWDRWCDRVAFFLGGKVGLTHHKSLDGAYTAVDGTVILGTFRTFESSTVVSGGADFGFDVCFCGNWSFVVTGSVIASCGPASNPNTILLSPSVPEQSLLLVGQIGTELRFPVTAGIRYSF